MGTYRASRCDVVKYFVGLGYLLWVLGRFGTVLSALPFVEGLLLLLLGAVGCFYIVRSLDLWLVAFEAQREGGRKPI